MAHHNRAMTLTKLGRREEALAAHDQALTMAPDQAFFHTQKGIALAVAGEIDSALIQFDAACRLQPELAGEAEAWAAAILWHRGDAQGSRERFARVKGRVTGTATSHATELEAIARCALGDPGGAEQALRDVAAEGLVRHDRLAPLYDLLSDPPLTGVDRLRAITAD